MQVGMALLVSFSITLSIQVLEIDCASWGAIFLRNNNHWATPCNWVANGNRGNDASFNISVKTFFDLHPPMVGNLNRGVSGMADCIGFLMDFGRWARQRWEWW